MSVTLPEVARPPITSLTEEEQMFRDMVRQFAEENVRRWFTTWTATRKWIRL
jgi:hypothetical protein